MTAPAPQASAAEVRVERAYTKCRFGQMHYLKGEPKTPSSKTPLILLHQNPSSSLEYSALVDEMSRDRTVIALDTPGNGMSDWPPETPSIEDYAASFADGLTELGYGAGAMVDVFGFHSGTFYASELALSRPDLVRRLVLCGVPFRTGEERGQRLHNAINTPPLSEDGEATFNQMRFLWDFAVVKRDPRAPLERAAAIFAEMVKPLQRASWPYIAVWSYPAEDRLPNIAQPTLLLAPKDITYPNTVAAAALISDAKLVSLDDLSASVFDVGVERFATELRDFLG
jgi:pimeloyl-ACP methyl ester carboxylesterase